MHGNTTFEAPTEIRALCPICGAKLFVTVEFSDFLKYMRGDPIEDCFPYLTPYEREHLISGTCEECWNRIFRESD